MKDFHFLAICQKLFDFWLKEITVTATYIAVESFGAKRVGLTTNFYDAGQSNALKSEDDFSVADFKMLRYGRTLFFLILYNLCSYPFLIVDALDTWGTNLNATRKF